MGLNIEQLVIKQPLEITRYQKIINLVATSSSFVVVHFSLRMNLSDCHIFRMSPKGLLIHIRCIFHELQIFFHFKQISYDILLFSYFFSQNDLVIITVNDLSKRNQKQKRKVLHFICLEIVQFIFCFRSGLYKINKMCFCNLL